MDLREPLIEATKKLKALREQIDDLQHRAHEPIAIVGMACRLPGGVDSPESLWHLLDEGRDAIEPFPASRWSADDLYSADPGEAGKTYCTRGGFVRDVDRFDAAFFGIAPREAESMDPAQRLALECVWEALERAAIRPAELAQSQTGVYLGTVYSDYEPWGGRLGMAGMDGYGFTGRDGSVLSGRISYTLGLRGPAITINTACSSSLVALHLAVQALRAGECPLAICGGSQVMTTPGCFVEFSRLGGMARDGRCKSFSDEADGVGWAEGCTILVLQRLSDALRDGRPILALVRGTAVNQDGRSQGLTAPNGPAQERVIERALAESGLTSDDLDVVEAHGTGTSLGDPIEAGALSAVFGPNRSAERPLFVGSLKSNLGHTQAASGTAGVIKLVLALGHEKLPRSLHAQLPTRRIEWRTSGLQLLQEARAWPRAARPRRAGVNSFGISGTNAHVILEEPPVAAPAPVRVASGTAPLVVSGANAAALADQAIHLADRLEAHPDEMLDVAFSLATTRTHHAARLALAVPIDRPASAVAAALRAFASGQAPPDVVTGIVERRPGKLVMLFSGQGSQRPGMGKALYERFGGFRAALDAICAELDPRIPQPLRDVMFAAPETAAARLLDQTEYTQPALFALEVALYRQWEAWGVVPDLVLGHSIGELAAAHVAGVLSLADACTLVAARGRLMQRARPGGAMISIAARDTVVAEHLVGLEDRVSIAALNTPDQTVISGDQATVEAIATKLQLQGTRVHRLRVSHAFHSPHMDAILEEYREVARTLTYRVPRIGLLSNLTGALATDQLVTSDYWVRQVRGAVRWRDAIRTAESLGADRYLECGPRAVLAAMAAECASRPVAVVPSLDDGRDEARALELAIGRAHVTGATLDWDRVFAGRGARRISVPTYAFQREHFWLDGAGREDRDLEAVGLGRVPHALLGAETPRPDGSHLFTARLTRGGWLAEHEVFGSAVVPGMALAEMAISAGTRVGVAHLREVTFEAPLRLEAPVQLQIELAAADPSGRRAFLIHARSDGSTWTRIASGSLEPESVAFDARAVAVPGEAAIVELDGIYERLAAKGLRYGAAFRGLREVRRHGRDLYGRVELPSERGIQGHVVHPALLDACLHVVLAGAGPDAELRIPFELEQVRLAPSSAVRELRVHVEIEEDGAAGIPAHARMYLHDPTGALVGAIGRIGFRAASAAKLAAPGDVVHRLDWIAAPASVARPRPGRCAVVGSGTNANEVAAALRASGAHVVRFDTATDLPARLAQHDGAISTVVRVLEATAATGAAPAIEETARTLTELQTWLGGTRVHDCRYVVVTSRATTGASLAQAPLWGLVRAVRVENPDRRFALIDLDGTEPSFDALAAALFADDEPEVVLREGRRLVPRLVRAPDATVFASAALAKGTVLVTGGTGGLGAEVAKHLATRHRVEHLLLVSRRGRAGADELIRELEAAGAQVTCAACDVADAAALQRVVDAIPAAHPLTGVFHCAAVVEDALTPSVSRDTIERVFASKVIGAWNLHQLAQDRPISAFVLFSSIAGLIGNEGQSIYAAANTFLDALSAARHGLGQPAHSLVWGPWAETGMAARQSARHQGRLRDLGLVPLRPSEAVALMDRALGSRDPWLGLLRVDEAALRGPSAAALARLLAVPATASAAPEQPGAKPALRDRIAVADREQRARLLLDLVRDETAAVLKLPSIDVLHQDKRLDELGMDSLMAVDIRRRLETRLTLKLPATLVFDHPSCAQLVTYLLDVIARQS